VTVGELQARLHPVLLVGPDVQARLVELPVPWRAERDVHRLADRERGQQGVRVLMDEAVCRVAPGVASLPRGHVEVAP
jgi:hypothetical protein